MLERRRGHTEHSAYTFALHLHQYDVHDNPKYYYYAVCRVSYGGGGEGFAIPT